LKLKKGLLVMPKKGGRKTPQERAFIEAYVETGSAKAGAAAAGYTFPKTAGHTVLARPAIKEAIALHALEKLQKEILPIALRVHAELLTDPKVPAGAKVQAVKLAYDRALGPESADSKPLHEMTGEELAASLDRVRRELADRAKPVIDGEIAQSVPSVLD